MEEELKKLQEISAFFKKINSKILLLMLITRAKEEYYACNFDEARRYLEKGEAIDSNNPVIIRGLGCLKQSEGDFDSAISYFKKALNISDKKEIEYTLIGMAYYLIENLDEAVKYFNLAIDCNDNYTKAYEGRNQAMLENHIKIVDLQEALKKYF